MEMMDVLMDLEANNAILEKQDQTTGKHPLEVNYEVCWGISSSVTARSRCLRGCFAVL